MGQIFLTLLLLEVQYLFMSRTVSKDAEVIEKKTPLQERGFRVVVAGTGLEPVTFGL